MTGRADESFGALAQAETNRALRKSLAAFREVIEQAGATQERSTRLIQADLEGFAAATQAQLELTKGFMAPMGAQPEAFGA